jgi:hypothetical protein
MSFRGDRAAVAPIPRSVEAKLPGAWAEADSRRSSCWLRSGQPAQKRRRGVRTCSSHSPPPGRKRETQSTLPRASRAYFYASRAQATSVSQGRSSPRRLRRSASARASVLKLAAHPVVINTGGSFVARITTASSGRDYCREVDVALEEAQAVHAALVLLAGERKHNAAFALAELLSRRLSPVRDTCYASAEA